MSEIRRGAQKKPCLSGAKFGFVCRACPRGLREQARRLNANQHSRLHSAGETRHNEGSSLRLSGGSAGNRLKQTVTSPAVNPHVRFGPAQKKPRNRKRG